MNETNQTVRNIEIYVRENGDAVCNYCGTPVTPETNRNAPCQGCIARAAKLEAKRQAEIAASAVFAGQLVSVKRTAVKKGFQFVGTLANGETIVLRAVATRPYTVAAIHSRSIVSKFDMPDVRGFVTFHQAAPKPQGSWDSIIATVPIEGEVA